MIKRILIAASASAALQIAFSQSYETKFYEEIYFVGYGDEGAVFTDESNYVYLWKEDSSIRFDFLDSGRLSFFPDKFVGLIEINGPDRRYVETFKLPFKVIVTTSDRIYNQEINLDAEGISTDFSRLKAYIGNQTDNPDRHESLPIHQLDLKTGELKELPMNGINPNVIGDHLFYADYPNPDQFDLVYDIYRIRIGDWQNPEKIFENNYMNGWKVSTDGKYLLAEVIEKGYTPQMVIYSIDEQKYAPIQDDDLPGAVFYSKEKRAFCFYDIGLYSEGKRRFVYVDVPEVFSYTPLWSITFGDSFITPYLLDEASEEELMQLDKDQLRLLRNAIFARKGWRFQSEDLRKFFGQFEWYQEKLKRINENEEIELTNADKYRSQLILKVEGNK